MTYTPPAHEEDQPAVEPSISGQVDYFAFDESFTCYLPDGKSWIAHKALNEGQRRAYLKQASREVRFRKGGEASTTLDAGEERRALLTAAITGWNLVRGGSPVVFNPANLNRFLEAANPKVLDIIEKDVRLHNPWLLQEMTVEDIDREIEALQEMRAAKVAEDEKEGRFR